MVWQRMTNHNIREHLTVSYKRRLPQYYTLNVSVQRWWLTGMEFVTSIIWRGFSTFQTSCLSCRPIISMSLNYQVQRHTDEENNVKNNYLSLELLIGLAMNKSHAAFHKSSEVTTLQKKGSILKFHIFVQAFLYTPWHGQMLFIRLALYQSV